MKIGIYLGYRPGTQFNNQGLGRFLANLTEGLLAEQAQEVTVLCPSWLRSDIEKHLAGTSQRRVRVIAPTTIPPLVKVYERTRRKTKQSKPSRLKAVLKAGRRAMLQANDAVFSGILHVLSTRWMPAFVVALILLAVLVIALAPLLLALALIALLFVFPPIVRLRRAAQRRIVKVASQAAKSLPGASVSFNGKPRMPLRWAAYDYVQDSEIKEMLALAESNKDVDVWYVPTVFWPEASALKPAVVQCFPDMLLSEFPTKFTQDGSSALPVYEKAKQAIQGGQYFITYSRATADKSLVRHFAIQPTKVFAVPHAPMDLSHHLAIQGTLDDDYAKRRLATTILEEHRNASWSNDRYLNNFSFEDTTYIFYASQFRPNKNLLNLIYAYENVLRKKHLYAKLILTGSAEDAPEFEKYVNDQRLQYDVLFAHDVSDRVLAALYHRAALVVNPTFFEGGFPFTFSEGMSVGTPSVMSRIPQTEEMITGELAQTMLFDPFSADDIADRVAFGLHNRQLLIDLQKPLFDQMKQRTWRNVARDHIDVFEKVMHL